MSIALKAKLLILMHKADFTYDGAYTLCSCGWKVQRGSSVADDHSTHLAEVLNEAFTSKPRTVSTLHDIGSLRPGSVIGALKAEDATGSETAAHVYHKISRTGGDPVWLGVGSYSLLGDQDVFGFLQVLGLTDQILVLWEPLS